ncbi:hypothetical protein JCM11641_002473 [Rhodosporidiobolus odoratus]
MSKTIAVIGATGHQGSGVISALLSSTDFAVRAITRDPSSDAAKALGSDPRLTVVKADLDDLESLKAAFVGVQGVFAMTTTGPAEQTQGRNLVDAIKAAGVERTVLSSLPSIGKASGGKFNKVFHFDGKAAIEEYAKAQLSSLTVVVPGVFYSHLARPLYTQRLPDGTVRFCSRNQQPSAGLLDASDVGVFAAAIFSKPLSVVSGKIYPVMSTPSTLSDFAEIYAAKTGDKVIVDPISKDEIHSMMVGVPHGEMIAAAVIDTFDYLDSAPEGTTCYGTMQLSDDTSSSDLGVKVTSFEEWLGKTGWKV